MAVPLLFLLLQFCSGSLFAWFGLTPKDLRKLSPDGTVGPKLSSTPLYEGVAVCTNSGGPTAPCVGKDGQFDDLMFTTVSADGKFMAIPAPNYTRWNWCEGVGVSAYNGATFIIGMDVNFPTTTIYKQNDKKWDLITTLSFPGGFGTIDSFVATSSSIWFGLGNTSMSHWDRTSDKYTFVGVDLSAPRNPPRIVNASGFSWTDCHWSVKHQNILCISKLNQANGPTALRLLDSSNGQLKTLCDDIRLPNNIYPTSTVLDGEALYLAGYEQRVNADPRGKFYVVNLDACSSKEQKLSVDADLESLVSI